MNTATEEGKILGSNGFCFLKIDHKSENASIICLELTHPYKTGSFVTSKTSWKAHKQELNYRLLSDKTYCSYMTITNAEFFHSNDGFECLLQSKKELYTPMADICNEIFSNNDSFELTDVKAKACYIR